MAGVGITAAMCSETKRIGIGRSPIQGQVDEYVRVDEDHRYFLASASYRESSRPAGLNLPRQRDANDEASSETRSRSSISIRAESETPCDRAYRFALGTRSLSTVIVSFCFMGLVFIRIRVHIYVS